MNGVAHFLIIFYLWLLCWIKKYKKQSLRFGAAPALFLGDNCVCLYKSDRLVNKNDCLDDILVCLINIHANEVFSCNGLQYVKLKRVSLFRMIF